MSARPDQWKALKGIKGRAGIGAGGRSSMVGKIHGTGRSLRGALEYVDRDKGADTRERVAWTEGVNIPTNRADAARAFMEATAAQNARTTSPAYHFTISFSPGSEPSRQEASEIARQALKDMGLGEHQAFLAAHRDTAHPHVHVVANRVHPETGKTWAPSHDFARLERSLTAQSKARGFEIIPGRHNWRDLGRDRPAARSTYSSGELRRMERTGQPSFRDLVAGSQVKDAMRQATTWRELEHRLSEQGLRLEKRGRGLVVTDGAEVAKASSIDRASSLHGLERRLGSYDDWQRERGPERGGREAQDLARAGGRERAEADGRPGRADPGEAGRGAGAPSGVGRGDGAGGGEAGSRQQGTAPGERPSPTGDGRGPDAGRVPGGGQRGGDGVGRQPMDGGPEVDARRIAERAREMMDEAPRRAVERLDNFDHWRRVQGEAEKAMAEARRDLAGREKAEATTERRSEALDRALSRVYAKPEKARERFEALAREQGGAEALKRLQERPQDFGRLQGVGVGRFQSPGRARATGEARHLPNYVRQWSVSKVIADGLPAKEVSREIMEAAGQQIEAAKRGLGPDLHRSREQLERDGARAWRQASPEAREKVKPGERKKLEAMKDRERSVSRERWGRGGPERGGRGR